MWHEIVAEKLRAARLSTGLRQKELGHLLGVANTSVSRYERRLVRPSLDYIEKVAEVTGFPLWWFFSDDTNMDYIGRSVRVGRDIEVLVRTSTKECELITVAGAA